MREDEASRSEGFVLRGEKPDGVMDGGGGGGGNGTVGDGSEIGWRAEQSHRTFSAKVAVIVLYVRIYRDRFNILERQIIKNRCYMQNTIKTNGKTT